MNAPALLPGYAPPLSCPECEWSPAPGQLWPTEGARAVWWIQKFCICGEGDWYGKPLRLRADQKRSLYRWYEYCGSCGRWRYQQWIRSEATGGGKTTFMGAVETLELGGPPEISPVSPIIVSAANSWDQANKLFGAASVMCGGPGRKVKESPLREFFEVYDSTIIRADGRPGRIIRVAAVAGTNEGESASLFVADEVHEFGDIGEGRARMHVVIGKSTNKRNLRCEIPVRDESGKITGVREVERGPGRIIDISTAGFDVKNSFFGAMYLHGKAVADDPSLEPGLLFECWEADDDLDFEDPADRLKAVRQASPAAGVLWNPMDRVREWGNPKTPKHEWARYYANRWEEIAEDSWLKDYPAAWGRCRGAWELAGAEPVVLPVDMSLTRDSTAVGELTLLADGRIAAAARIWKAPPGGKIDHLDVLNHIRARAKALGPRMRGVVYDPRYFELASRMLEDEGIPVIQFDQAPALMAPACGEAFDAIVGQEIVWGGDPAYAEWDDEFGGQVKAAAKRQQDRGFTLSKGKSKRRIDSAICLCMGVYTLKRVKPPRRWANTVW